MNQLALLSEVSVAAMRMTSAELVGSQPDSVKRTIERLAESEVNNNQSLSPNSRSKCYVFEGEQGKRNSIVVVAQLSPLFTAKLVDRRQELEKMVSKIPAQKPQKEQLKTGTTKNERSQTLFAFTQQIAAGTAEQSETNAQPLFAL